MQETHAEDRRAPGSRSDRLVRDMIALGSLDAGRPTASERLDSKLGPDLVAAIRAELAHSSSRRVARRSRRVA